MFEIRSQEAEFLDQSECDPTLAIRSYRFMKKVNHLLGGIRMVQDFIEAEAKKNKSDLPLRILDIGSGDCDIPITISRWAREKKIPLQFTCLEVADFAVNLARENIASSKETSISLLQEDVFEHRPQEPYDGAIASMCFHHFADQQILALLQKMRNYVKRSVLINDLRRSRLSWLATSLVTAFSHSGVRHDSMLSIRRGFKIRELHDLLMQLDNASIAVVKKAWLFRICAIINFKQDNIS